MYGLKSLVDLLQNRLQVGVNLVFNSNGNRLELTDIQIAGTTQCCWYMYAQHSGIALERYGPNDCGAPSATAAAWIKPARKSNGAKTTIYRVNLHMPGMKYHNHLNLNAGLLAGVNAENAAQAKAGAAGRSYVLDWYRYHIAKGLAHGSDGIHYGLAAYNARAKFFAGAVAGTEAYLPYRFPRATPSTTRAVTVKPTAGGNVTLTWTAPASNGGAPITDYIVKYTTVSANGPWYTKVDAITAKTGAVFTRLANGRTYWFAVAARNVVGYGPYTYSGPVVPYTVPDAPTAVTATAPDANTVTAAWTAPGFDGGRPITGYVLRYSTTGPTGPWSSTRPAASPHTLTGLPFGTYWIAVAATNAAGTGAWAVSASPVTVHGPAVE